MGYNNVFGYYIEVTNTHKAKVPAEWIRKQTLVNAERYITPELEKLRGTDPRSAGKKIDIIQNRLFGELIAAVAEFIPVIQLDASLLASWMFSTPSRVYLSSRTGITVLSSTTASILILTEARHPVIERQLPPGEPYISNTVELSNEGTQIMMITGPQHVR